jgi:hypothetical protein
MAVNINTGLAGVKGVKLDRALWSRSNKVVLSRTTPLPLSPADGDFYIVPSSDLTIPNQIAFWSDDEADWLLLIPTEGWVAYVVDANQNVQFDGSSWVQFDAGGIPSSYLDTDTGLTANSNTRVPSQQAVKTYVDGIAVNLGKRQRVRAATTANITISTALNNADTLDGVTLATGDYVLVKDQSSAAENGIYMVGVSPARTSEFDTYNEHPGSLIAVEEGTANADSIWLCTSNAGGTLGSTSIVFSHFTAGSGDVVGPGSATDENPAVFDGVTGKLLKELSYSTFTTKLSVMVGDSGSGGTKGLVPAPASGDAAANKFLKADGTWSALTGIGLGDVTGPGSSTANAIVLFNGTSGKVIKDSLITVDTDGTLAANSDTVIATQKAVKTYADALIAANDAMVFKGVTDCSANPNYPAADRGATYRVSVAGKIGGASGINVEVGDMFICLDDGTASGNQATVGSHWSIIQTNLDGAVINTRQIISGNGLTGGGDLSADRTLAVGAGTGIVSNADDVAIDKATAANVWAATSNKVLTSDIIFTAADPVTLTDAATIAVDMATFLNAKVTIAGNRTLGAPSNVKNGQSGCIEIIQDGTGSRTLAYHADWLFAGGTDPVLSTAAGTKDLLFYQVLSNGKTFGSLVKAVA